jgi:Mrp family chromosome partitioning ATPase
VQNHQSVAARFGKPASETRNGHQEPAVRHQPAAAAATVKSIAFLESYAAQIIGVTGIRQGAGVTPFAGSLANSYAAFGRKVLLVQAGCVLQAGPPSAWAPDRHCSLLDLATPLQQSSGVCHLNLDASGMVDAENAEAWRYALQEARNTFDVIVIDLPPRLGDHQARGIPPIAAACDAVLLLCVAGETTRADLQDCLRVCKIQKLNVVGLVLNEGKLRLGNFLGRS